MRQPYQRHHHRRPTYPQFHSMRQKPRRWPLVLRFAKGAVHAAIVLPVLLHAIFTALIVYLDINKAGLGLPSSIVPSLSIVVGLMLVFRNQTSYDRFWTGRNYITTIATSVRNLSRSFLTCSQPAPTEATPNPRATPAERHDTERTVRILLAVLYAVKHNLRAEWNTPSLNGPNPAATITSTKPEFSGLLPENMRAREDEGLALPLQLTVAVESYVRRGHERGWFHAPQASQLTVQINTIMDAYGKLETIRHTPIPVAYLIHTRQVLALFCCVLPFAVVDELGWYSVPIVSLVVFTLYGIEGIGSQLEDPFGYDKNDIKMDGIIEDARQEIFVLLDEWRRGGEVFK
ncbi:Bestrophin/UPF0187 [Lineolata rhizophorae]|uniref:Bestrophin/UPF0187 n=1 Tax=Lineolata rhizophorae TaxID=578093 RepID=A0A6A6NPW1_9PEZI|nr:Bestrophin/UPF0187 [Lineolata rhizophorae]